MAGWAPWPALKSSKLSKVAEPSCRREARQYASDRAGAAEAARIADKMTYRSGARVATTVDQLIDRVRVVGEVSGQGLVGELIAVVGNEGLEVVCNGVRGRVTQAVGSGASYTPAGPRCGSSSSCESRDGEEGGTHSDDNEGVVVERSWGLDNGAERMGRLQWDASGVD